ncbi:hypothetical protein I4F81_004872 [Pyropia yezoensis]|uniref:Uncharacterized protein n=1 Tax=Pyropia yezoensis TaxID=2788 RepID=A0ACC3BWR6_PYRYE|nr:hypothetical protein I4F81_004872 [Neopyropia yezoensis]
MGRAEATHILGLPSAGRSASAAHRGAAYREAVVAAHRRLMRANHPDAGGSTPARAAWDGDGASAAVGSGLDADSWRRCSLQGGG